MTSLGKAYHQTAGKTAHILSLVRLKYGGNTNTFITHFFVCVLLASPSNLQSVSNSDLTKWTIADKAPSNIYTVANV